MPLPVLCKTVFKFRSTDQDPSVRTTVKEKAIQWRRFRMKASVEPPPETWVSTYEAAKASASLSKVESQFLGW